MKKILVMSALAAVSTAFVACSSDDDLVQQAPVVPEVKGTPFSISVNADTRATLYNADAWGTSGANAVTMLKLYGKQNGQTTPWLNSAVFTRSATSADWTANRDATHTSLGETEKPTWPKTNANVATDFYAITDNAIGDGTTALISNVGAWMTTPGTFDYTMGTLTANLPQIDKVEGTGYVVEGGVSTDYVDASKLKDLMVASATTKETTDGKLDLAFSHILAGLNVKIIFRNDAVYNDASGSKNASIHYIKIMGLKTSGAYSYTSGWSGLSDYVCYYKAFSTPIVVNAFLEESTAAAADENKWLVSNTDPWMVIPQTTDPWDCQGLESGDYIADGKAYVVLGITDHQDTEDVEVFLPLDTEFVAGKNKTLRLDLGKFRDLYNNTGEAAYYFAPAAGGGGARGYDFVDE